MEKLGYFINNGRDIILLFWEPTRKRFAFIAEFYVIFFYK